MDAKPYEAGAGRGRPGGPTAEELREYDERGLTTERKIRRGDYGPPGTAPTDPMPPAKKAVAPTKPVVKKAAGGSVTRADGCVTKGHTRGTMR